MSVWKWWEVGREGVETSITITRGLFPPGMSDQQLSPWAGTVLGALVAGSTTAIAGVALDGARALAVGLGLAMPILLVYGAGETFDRDRYLADRTTGETVLDSVLIATVATVSGVVCATAVTSISGSTVVIAAFTAGVTFLGGIAALYGRRAEYYGPTQG